MQRTLEEIVGMNKLKDGQLVSVRLSDSFFKGKIVGIGASSLVPQYIVECIDGTFPNDIYGFKFLNIPATEIFLNED
jgi:uncharacterized protein YwlG (UPF0340 family)